MLLDQISAGSPTRQPALGPIMHANRLPCSRRLVPNKPASPETLAKLGVLYWKLDADKHEMDPKLAAIRKVRGYSYIVSLFPFHHHTNFQLEHHAISHTPRVQLQMRMSNV